MKQSSFDSAVDILLTRQKDTTSELARRFKNTRPFRQEPIPRKEVLLNYDEMMAREEQLRQDFGDETIDNYKQIMLNKLGGK